MRLPARIRKILDDPSNNDLLAWSTLLIFFDENQNKLYQYQKIKLFKKCEDMRDYWNNERRNTKTFMDHMGNKREILDVGQPLGIEKEDVSPDTIYTDRQVKRHVDTLQT